MKKMTWRSSRTKDHTKLSECSGKVGFPQKSEARVANRRLDGELYKCRFCNLWHIAGHRKRRNPKTKQLECLYPGCYNTGA